MIATRTKYGYDLGMTRGDTESLVVTMTVKNGNGRESPFNASLATLTVRTSRDGDLVFSIDADQVSDGVAYFSFPHELTENMSPGKYVYDIQATAGNVVKTPVGGLSKPCYFSIWQDVTYED